MNSIMKASRFFWIGAAAAALAACGGGGGGTITGGGGGGGGGGQAVNVATVTVDSGPSGLMISSENTLFTTVEVCVPGTTNCQTIDHIIVDTGASGLRILASSLSLTLPHVTNSSNDVLAECFEYVQGYVWGSVATADMTIGEEKAAAMPIQIIGDPNYATVPADCAGSGTNLNTLDLVGGNGYIGVSVFALDGGLYYSCATTTTCTSTNPSATQQIPNPVTLFAKDNNGVIIALPSAPNSGAASLTGTMTFGIDTETNNTSSGTALLTLDPTQGFVTTTLNDVAGVAPFPQSFFDTGSNAYYFNVPTTVLTQCADQANQFFYCPTTDPTGFTATVTGQGAGSASTSIGFAIGNADNLSTSLAVLPTLGGTGTAQSFDWGLPFFYNRKVYLAIVGQKTIAGTGPYIAF